MPKKSKKSKSKRVPLKKKYKILKRVKQHHKKKAKEAKKLGLNKKSKVEKDPGIPNDWPFKEQELKALEVRRARALEELEQKKAARKERAKKRKLGLVENDETDDMEDQNDEGENAEAATSVGKVKDNSERAFYKELVKVVEASDVILEVLDARDPQGSRCLDMEKMVKSKPEKRLVLLMNKIDLVPREAVEKWLKYLREELPAVAFKCSTQQQRSNLGWKGSSKTKKSKSSNNIPLTSDCLGAESLIKLLKNYSRSHDIKKTITVGIIGLPNVGKSSIINSLKRSHVVNVGSTPGLTRSMQEVHLDKNVKLLDCPGVVMLNSSENDARIALRNCKRIEKLEDPVAPVKEILNLCEHKILVALYKVPSFDSVDDFLLKVATVRGKLKKGGVVDVEAAARIVLHDWNEGKIPFYTMPPVRNEGELLEETRIVSEFGKEFNVEEVYGTDSVIFGTLKSVIEFQAVEVPSNPPLPFDEQMLEGGPAQKAQDDVDERGAMDQSMEEPTDSAVAAKSSTSRQNEKLYDAEGMLNTKIKKAQKKRRKKAGKEASSRDAMDADKDNDEYDFKVDYRQGGSSMIVDGENDVGGIPAKVPMAGIELDNE